MEFGSRSSSTDSRHRESGRDRAGAPAYSRRSVRPPLQSQGDSADGVVIEVRDNGPGIPAHIRERLFEPFVTGTPPGRGTGLGLSICRDLATSWGGSIDVDSRPGGGTTVRICLPRAADAPTPASGPAVARQAQGPAAGDAVRPLRILLVDDEPLLLRSTRRIWRAHRVTLAGSGREALERYREADFDVVLCDLIMGDLTGMDLYERIAQEWPGHERSIVFMSGGAFLDDACEFLERVPNRCLDKPLDRVELEAILTEHQPPARAAQTVPPAAGGHG